MAKNVISEGGEDVVVREDTAKAFRGVHWALWSIGAFVVIAGILFAIFFIGAASEGDLERPSQIQDTNTR